MVEATAVRQGAPRGASDIGDAGIVGSTMPSASGVPFDLLALTGATSADADGLSTDDAVMPDDATASVDAAEPDATVDATIAALFAAGAVAEKGVTAAPPAEIDEAADLGPALLVTVAALQVGDEDVAEADAPAVLEIPVEALDDVAAYAETAMLVSPQAPVQPSLDDVPVETPVENAGTPVVPPTFQPPVVVAAPAQAVEAGGDVPVSTSKALSGEVADLDAVRSDTSPDDEATAPETVPATVAGGDVAASETAALMQAAAVGSETDHPAEDAETQSVEVPDAAVAAAPSRAASSAATSAAPPADADPDSLPGAAEAPSVKPADTASERAAVVVDDEMPADAATAAVAAAPSAVAASDDLSKTKKASVAAVARPADSDRDAGSPAASDAFDRPAQPVSALPDAGFDFNGRRESGNPIAAEDGAAFEAGPDIAAELVDMLRAAEAASSDAAVVSRNVTDSAFAAPAATDAVDFVPPAPLPRFEAAERINVTVQAAAGSGAPEASRAAEALMADLRSRAVERQVLAAMRQGRDEVRISLYPPHLGQVVIRMALDGQKVRISMRAVNGEAEDALQSGEAGLRDALGREGFVLSGFDVDSRNEEEGRRAPQRPYAPQTVSRNADLVGTFSIEVTA